MNKSVVGLAISVLLLSACAGPGAAPSIVIPTSGDSLERVKYTDNQVQVYKDSLIYETLRMNTVEGLAWETDVSDAQWNPYIVRAKAFCDDARTNGWFSAKDSYAQQVVDEAMNAAPDAALELVDLDDLTQEILAPILEAQLRAIAAEGSLCPDLAPEGFVGTVIDPDTKPTPEGEPMLDGKYYGEGCEGAGNALMELLMVLRGIDDGSTTRDSFEDDLLNIAGGLRYSALSESDPQAALVINEGASTIAEVLASISDGNAEAFATGMVELPEQAIRILDVCNLD